MKREGRDRIPGLGGVEGDGDEDGGYMGYPRKLEKRREEILTAQVLDHV